MTLKQTSEWLIERVRESRKHADEHGHPFSDEVLREHWRSAGGSFHGASPDFFGSMPEKRLLKILRSASVATAELLKLKGQTRAHGIDVGLCEDCSSLHIHLLNQDESIKAGITLDTPEELEKFIEALKGARRDMLKRRHGATMQ